MKKILIVSATLAMTFTASAVLMSLFSSYDGLKNRSSDIIIARCIVNTPPPFPDRRTITSDVNTFSIEIITALKGTNFSGSFLLKSERWLSQGDNYLIFGNCQNGVCEAIEDFRVIPLGRELWVGTITNSIAGKPLDDQIQILFKQRIANLNQQIQAEQEEKQRLEAGIKK